MIVARSNRGDSRGRFSSVDEAIRFYTQHEDYFITEGRYLYDESNENVLFLGKLVAMPSPPPPPSVTLKSYAE